MRKFIFCFIALASIATLLLPSGQVLAKSKWRQWPIGNNVNDFLDKWDVEPFNPSCYNYNVVNGTLIVNASSNCTGERFFAKIKDDGEAQEIRVDATAINSFGCWRTRLLADPLYVPAIDGMPIPGSGGAERDGTVFHQLALLNEWCFPSMVVKLIAYPAQSPWLSLFDASFATQWVGPGIPNVVPIVGNTFTLTLSVSVQNDTINSMITDGNGQTLGEIVYEAPGLEIVGGNFLGLSCFSPDNGDSGTAYFSNVWVR